MNIYEIEFVSRCPNDGTDVTYYLEIISNQMIMLEDINELIVGKFKVGFHEQIADELFAKFGGKQSIMAKHKLGRIHTIRETL